MARHLIAILGLMAALSPLASVAPAQAQAQAQDEEDIRELPGSLIITDEGIYRQSGGDLDVLVPGPGEQTNWESLDEPEPIENQPTEDELTEEELTEEELAGELGATQANPLVCQCNCPPCQNQPQQQAGSLADSNRGSLPGSSPESLNEQVEEAQWEWLRDQLRATPGQSPAQ